MGLYILWNLVRVYCHIDQLDNVQWYCRHTNYLVHMEWVIHCLVDSNIQHDRVHYILNRIVLVKHRTRERVEREEGRGGGGVSVISIYKMVMHTRTTYCSLWAWSFHSILTPTAWWTLHLINVIDNDT
jgi:hypothetical protein